MLLNKSSEDLEIKMLRSFSFNFQKTYHLAFLEKVWLHVYGRNVATSEIGLLKEETDLTKEEDLGWNFKKPILEAFPGLLILISILCNWDNLQIWLIFFYSVGAPFLAIKVVSSLDMCPLVKRHDYWKQWVTAFRVTNLHRMAESTFWSMLDLGWRTHRK